MSGEMHSIIIKNKAMSNWISVDTQLPPRGTVVDTKVDDGYGKVTNEQQLKMHKTGRLWWFPDSSMYTYYAPTHWKLPEPPSSSNKEVKQ